MKPLGFGAPFWLDRIITAKGGEAGAARVVEELIAQTRLDEALSCRRSRFDGNDDRVEERIASHRRDLRAARRRAT